MMETESPGSTGNVKRTRKYDRQLRIWGDHGQYAIETSHVCLINATATGTEFLKSLVLSGIGSFTIIDNKQIDNSDDNNFYCDIRNALGQNRADHVTRQLLDVNPDVRGDYIDDSLENMIETSPDVFASFTIVVASNVNNENTLVKLSEILWRYSVPFIYIYTIGYIGLIRVQIIEHPVIESHPDNVLENLVFDQPFPELIEYLESYSDFSKLHRLEISHVPYLVIIYKYLKIWQQQNGKSDSCLPTNYREKCQLRDLIKNAIKSIRSSFKPLDGDCESEIVLENFEEAIKAVNQILVPSTFVPKETQKILDESVQKNLSKSRSKDYVTNFWLLVKALREFIDHKSNGCLPVRGSVPDMTASTDSYVKIQKIYANKAREDIELFNNCLQSICNTVGKSAESIPDHTVKLFCRNTHCLRLVKTSPLWAEFKLSDPTSPNVIKLREMINSCDLDDDENSDLIFYLMIRSVIRFHTRFNRYPGFYDDQVEIDIMTLKACFKEVLNELGCNNLSKDDFIHEMCSYGGCELHSIAAFTGGCAAQEAIKFITKQFVPMSSTFIYNALTSMTVTYDW